MGIMLWEILLIIINVFLFNNIHQDSRHVFKEIELHPNKMNFTSHPVNLRSSCASAKSNQSSYTCMEKT